MTTKERQFTQVMTEFGASEFRSTSFLPEGGTMSQRKLVNCGSVQQGTRQGQLQATSKLARARLINGMTKVFPHLPGEGC